MECKYCIKETPTWGGKGKKYCNIVCQRQYENKVSRNYYEDKECIICSNVFTPKSSVNICCSEKCGTTYDVRKRSKKPKFKNCNNCQKDFLPYTSLDKFCSANCRVENEKKKRKFNWSLGSTQKRNGVNNPGYKHGLSMRGTKPNSDGLREFQRNRKEYIEDMQQKFGYLFCERCNQSNKKLEAHHIIYRSEMPKHEYLNQKINITLVCVLCHNWYHKKKSNRNSLAEQRNLNLYFGEGVLNK